MSGMTKRWAMRLVLIAGSASLLAACQTTSPYAGQNDGPVINRPRPEFPTRAQGGLDNPPAPPPPESAPPQDFRPSPPVTSQPLPPPVDLPPPSQPVAPPPAPVYVPPAPPPPPQFRTVTIGPVVEAEGPPKVYTVKAGDNLDAIARDMGTTRKELADKNDLKEPYKLKPGQKLKGPAGKNSKAYVVQQGDTLSAIGRRFSVTASALASENDMATSDSLRPGKRLLLPQGYKDNGPARIQVTPAEAPPAAPLPAPVPTPAPTPAYVPPPAPAYVPPAQPPVQTPAYVPPPLPAQQQPQPQPTGAGCVSTNQLPSPLPPGFPTAAQLRQLAQGKFAWPIRGRVLTCFGPQPGVGVASNGIDIAANPNSAVRASAAGELIHANPVRGSGLTVLVQHADGWITIYSNLSSISVPTRDAGVTTDAAGKPLPKVRITSGQEIGRSGGGADGQDPSIRNWCFRRARGREAR